jgi:hypothetical protein
MRPEPALSVVLQQRSDVAQRLAQAAAANSHGKR